MARGPQNPEGNASNIKAWSKQQGRKALKVDFRGCNFATMAVIAALLHSMLWHIQAKGQVAPKLVSFTEFLDFGIISFDKGTSFVCAGSGKVIKGQSMLYLNSQLGGIKGSRPDENFLPSKADCLSH